MPILLEAIRVLILVEEAMAHLWIKVWCQINHKCNTINKITSSKWYLIIASFSSNIPIIIETITMDSKVWGIKTQTEIRASSNSSKMPMKWWISINKETQFKIISNNHTVAASEFNLTVFKILQWGFHRELGKFTQTLWELMIILVDWNKMRERQLITTL